MSTEAPRSRFVELYTGLRAHLLEWGDPQATDLTCILVHGFLDLAWGWDATCRAGLAERLHLVAPDMRGHGDSDRVGAGGYYHFADYVADLEGLLEHFPDRRIALVGHSMGGPITAYFAATFPDRVERLALLEGMGPPEIDRPPAARLATWIAGWRHAASRPPRRYADVAAAAARLRTHDPLLGEALSLELAERGTRPLAGGGLAFKHDPLHLTRGPYPFRLEDAAALWRQIGCPVLAVEGAESRTPLSAAERQRRYAHIADLRVEILAGAGHMMQRHRPAELARLLGDFLC